MAAAAVLTATVAACGNASGAGQTANSQAGGEVGLTATTIKIGVSFPLSGANAAYFAPQAQSAQAWVKHLNDQYGGLKLADGTTRKVELVLKDDAFNPERAVQNAKALVEKDGVFAIVGVPGTADAAAVASYTESVNVPLLFVQSSSSQWGDSTKYKQTVPIQPRSDLEGRNWVAWLAKNQPGTKIALLRDDTDFGKGLERGIKEAVAKSAGAVTLDEVQSYQSTDNTLTSQVTNLKESGANVLFNGAVGTFAPLAFKAIAASGWKPQTHILTNASSDVASAIAPAGVDNFQGVLTTVWLKDPTAAAYANDAFVEEWKAAIAKYAPDVKPTVVNMFAAMPMQALAAAVERTPNLTRAELVKTARSMDVALGAFAPGVRFSNNPETNEPITRLAIGVLEGEHFATKGDVLGTSD
jgi:branched-chain amino acid transport system substrate-binding protein